MPTPHTPKQKHLKPVPIEQTVTGERYPDVYQDFAPDHLERYEQLDESSVLLTAKNGVCLRIIALADDIFRFRYAPEGAFETFFSYALDPGAAYEAPNLLLSEEEGHVSLRTPSIICHIAKEGLRVSIYDAESQVLLSEDALPCRVRRSIAHGISEVRLAKASPAAECFYGLGDKSGLLNLRGQQLQNWNTDSFAYGAETDPLYRAIPFFMGLREGQGYGIFFHNTHRSHFDFDSAEQGQISFWAAGGEMDYFFINGPQLLQVAQRYAWLTGRPELPPMWAIGFHQCRWSYYPDERVREVAAAFREQQIPCDAIYLDIDYMDGYRCFTWNKDHFPKPAELIRALSEKGFQTVVMIDPGIKVDPSYHVYREGMERDAFCRRSNGELMRGPVWPPDCVFPDYTHPDVREWWGQLYEQLYREEGVSGFWNDMNEPAVFKLDIATFPDEVLHHYEGQTANHRRAHNVYGQQMSRATFEGLKRLRPDKRPFLLTRASFSGGQRYASVWTGDNVASWEHLRLANTQCQRLSLSGFSFVGTDVGGFSKQPDGELFVRWMQLGAFHPFYRVHSMGNNVDGAAEADAEWIQQSERDSRMDQEPWSFGEPYTSIAREAVELRYRLLPYLYTAFWQYTQSGRPILRSLVFEDQKDPATLQRENEFLFGNDLLVIPVLEAGATEVAGYLPAGDWYAYESGVAYRGRQSVKIVCGLERIPFFVRAGAVIPNYPVQQYVGEQQFEAISLRVYYGQGESELYEDAGEGYGYEQGGYCLSSFRTEKSGGGFELHQSRSGEWAPAFAHYELKIFGLPFKPARCTCDGQAVALEQEGAIWRARLPVGFRHLALS